MHREHRHREHTRRASRPVDGAVSPQTGSNSPATPLILTPAAAQVKDRDRDPQQRVRRSHGHGGTRDVSMSVQPLAPQSRHASHLVPRDANSAGHPYASASASPIAATPNTATAVGGGSAPYPRTTSNSPLPPLPSDDRERTHGLHGGMHGQSGSNVALAGGMNSSTTQGFTYASANMQRGVGGIQKADGGVNMGYGMANDAIRRERGMMDEEHAPQRGFFATLCCRT